MKSSSLKWVRSATHFVYSLRVDRGLKRKEDFASASLDLIELAASEEAIHDAHVAHLFNVVSSALVKTATHARVKPATSETLLKYLSCPLK